MRDVRMGESGAPSEKEADPKRVVALLAALLGHVEARVSLQEQQKVHAASRPPYSSCRSKQRLA